MGTRRSIRIQSRIIIPLAVLCIFEATLPAPAQTSVKKTAPASPASAIVPVDETDETVREVMELLNQEAEEEATGESATAAKETDADMELRYADGLIDLGLPDFAEMVMNKLGTGPDVKRRRVESLLARGKFDEVDALIKAEASPDSADAWAMKLALADGYFAWGKYKECREIYEKFFKQYKDAIPDSLRKFYADAAYKYAQLLQWMGDRRGTIEAYKMGLAAKPPREVERQFMSEMTEQMLKLAEESQGEERERLLQDIDQNCDKILWVQDLWFGKAIVMKAHVYIMRGKMDEAMALFDYYKPQLKNIDDQLTQQSTATEDLTRMSPMAQCRYLLGVILQGEGDKLLSAGGDMFRVVELLAGKDAADQLRIQKGQRRREQKPANPDARASTESEVTTAGALQHFINVFVRYPNTPWATDAGRRFRLIRETLEKQCGLTINVDITPAQWEVVQNAQLKFAKSLYNQQLFEQAADSYSSVLSLFPESASSVPAMGDLAMCYVEQDEDLFTEAVIGYVSERYGGSHKYSSTAGDVLLRIATAYEERKKKDQQAKVYERFFAHFKNHPRTPALLYKFGNDRLAAGDGAGALEYFERIVKENKGSGVYFAAYAKVAECHRLAGRTTDEIKTLRAYIEEVSKLPRPGHDLLRGIYQTATAYRNIGTNYYPNAIKHYSDVITRLRTRPNDYAGTEAVNVANQSMLEASLFYQAFCYAKIPPPAGQPPQAHRELALKTYQTLAADYPKSAFAPGALSQIGSLHSALGQSQDAEAAFNKLKTMYPNSPEAKNSDFQRAYNLLILGQRDQAVAAFKAMFGAEAGRFSDTQILTAGQELCKAKEYDIAIEALNKVLANTKDKGMIQTALLWKGRALQGKGANAEAVAALEELFANYPRTSFTVEASRYLARAYAAVGGTETDAGKRVAAYNKAVESIKRMQRYVKTPKDRMQAAIEIGHMTEVKYEAEKKYSAEKAAQYLSEAVVYYMITIDGADVTSAEILPGLEEAYEGCVRLMIESGLWSEAADYADKYLKQYSETGKYATKMRNWRGEARGKIISTAASVESRKPGSAVTPTNAP